MKREGMSGQEREDLLELRGVAKRFGGIAAVDGCSFEVERGSITGLIGPNGAGKSTLFNIASGVVRPDAGTVRLGGDDITGGPPEKVSRKGLARTFQTPRLFYRMSCWENLMLAGANQPAESALGALFRGAASRRRQQELNTRAQELLEFLSLGRLVNSPASELSGGQRKLLSLGRALMSEPRIVLLDEPAAGVNASLTRMLIERISELNDRGITFLIVEHDMDLIMSICRKVIVMHRGRVLAQGSAEEVQNDPAVVEAYLGGVA